MYEDMWDGRQLHKGFALSGSRFAPSPKWERVAAKLLDYRFRTLCNCLWKIQRKRKKSITGAAPRLTINPAIFKRFGQGLALRGCLYIPVTRTFSGESSSTFMAAAEQYRSEGLGAMA